MPTGQGDVAGAARCGGLGCSSGSAGDGGGLSLEVAAAVAGRPAAAAGRHHSSRDGVTAAVCRDRAAPTHSSRPSVGVAQQHAHARTRPSRANAWRQCWAVSGKGQWRLDASAGCLASLYAVCCPVSCTGSCTERQQPHFLAVDLFESGWWCIFYSETDEITCQQHLTVSRKLH